MQIIGIANSYASAPVNAPTSLSTVPTPTSVAISFTAPTNDGGTAITNYEYSFNNSTWTAFSPVDTTSPVSISGLTENTAYTVYLRAVNIVGVGPGSTGASFTTPLSPLPANFFVLAGGGGGAGGYIQPGVTLWTGGGGGAGGLRTSAGTNGGGAGLDSVITFSSGASATVTVGGGGAAGGVGGTGGYGGNSVFHTITAGGGVPGSGSTGGNAGSYGFAGRGVSSGVGGSGGGVGGASVTLLGSRYWGSTYYPGAGLADYATGIGRGGGGGNGGAYNVNGGENGIPGPSVNGSGSGGTNRAAGNPGASNYGGGGGGGSFYDYAGYNGAAGGSGIVIVTYPTTYGTLAGISGLAYSYSVSGSTRIYQFTSGSGTITFPTF
jgi:hypothetical protein